MMSNVAGGKEIKYSLPPAMLFYKFGARDNH